MQTDNVLEQVIAGCQSIHGFPSFCSTNPVADLPKSELIRQGVVAAGRHSVDRDIRSPVRVRMA